MLYAQHGKGMFMALAIRQLLNKLNKIRPSGDGHFIGICVILHHVM